MTPGKTPHQDAPGFCLFGFQAIPSDVQVTPSSALLVMLRGPNRMLSIKTHVGYEQGRCSTYYAIFPAQGASVY